MILERRDVYICDYRMQIMSARLARFKSTCTEYGVRSTYIDALVKGTECGPVRFKMSARLCGYHSRVSDSPPCSHPRPIFLPSVSSTSSSSATNRHKPFQPTRRFLPLRLNTWWIIDNHHPFFNVARRMASRIPGMSSFFLRGFFFQTLPSPHNDELRVAPILGVISYRRSMMIDLPSQTAV